MTRGGLASFRSRNLHSSPKLIRGVLKSLGLYRRARANAARVQVEETVLRFATLPDLFDGFTILHISDMHVDISEEAMRQLAELLPGLRCDLCVLTGDFRGKTYGPFDATLEGLARLRSRLPEPVYAVLGNHDSILMVPGLEAIGIRVLLNECEPIVRGNHAIHLAGIDDAHLYRLDDIAKAAAGIPQTGVFDPAVAHARGVPRGGFRRVRSAAWAGTRMAARSACPARSRSRSIRSCRGAWVREPGPMAA